MYTDQHNLEGYNNIDAIAQHYANSTSFEFSSETLADQSWDGLTDCRNYLFKHRKQISSSIKEHRLKQFISSAVPYMDEEQRAYWHALYTELFISALYQYNYYVVLNRKQKLAEAKALLQHYQSRLQYLESFADNALPVEKKPIFLAGNADWSPVGYLGFSVADWLLQQGKDLIVAPSSAVISWLSELNWHRLYWVWAGGSGGFLGSILDLESFAQSAGRNQASQKLESPGQITGYASWLLYFVRFGIHLALLIKHTVPNPWMTEEERQISFTERLAAQWDQRKYTMLNDFVWFWVNYASLYWYTSKISPMSGVIGGGLNVLLMFFDVSMARLALREEQAKVKQENEEIQQKITQAEQQLQTALKAYDLNSVEQVFLIRDYLNIEQSLQSGTLSHSQRLSLQKRQQELAIAPALIVKGITLEQCHKLIALDRLRFSLNQDLDILNFNWQYQQAKLVTTERLAWAFTFAMTLMFAPIFPVLLPALAVSNAVMSEIVFVGCLMSVLLTAYESAYDYQSDYNKVSALLDGLDKKQALITAHHQQLAIDADALTDAEKDALRLCHLESKRLSANRAYYQAELKHIRAKQYHSVFTQLSFPLVVFYGLFLTTTTLTLMVAASLMIVMLTKAIINSYAPEQVDNENILLTSQEYQNPQTTLLEDGAGGESHQEVEVDGQTKPITPQNSLARYGLFASNESMARSLRVDVQPGLSL